MDKTYILNEIKRVYKFNSDTDFAKHLGVSPQVLRNWKARNTYNPELIYTKCLKINPIWLLTGEKPVLKENKSFENLKKEFYKEKNSKNIVNEGNSDYKNNITKKYIPLIPTEAFAGLGGGEVTIKDNDIQERYVVPEFTNVDFMIRIKGSSMYPKYNSGDVVACKMITNSKFIQWNKVHVISTRMQGVLIKRLRKSDVENCLLAVSDNKSYGSFDIPQDEIINIAIVTGVIRLE